MKIPFPGKALRFWGIGHRGGGCGAWCNWSLYTTACVDSLLESDQGLTPEGRQRANPKIKGRQREAAAQTKSLCNTVRLGGRAGEDTKSHTNNPIRFGFENNRKSV